MAAPIYQILTGIVENVKSDLVTISFHTIYKNRNESTRDISKIHYYNMKSIFSNSKDNMKPGATVKLYRIFREGKPRDDIFSFFPPGSDSQKLLEFKPQRNLVTEPLMGDRPFEPDHNKPKKVVDDEEDEYISVGGAMIIEDTVLENV